MRLLFNTDSAAGGGPTSDQSTESNPVPAPAAAPSNTPAADTVNNGAITEDTVLLKQKLADAEKKIKQREQEHASVTDEFTRYKDAIEARRAPRKQTEPTKKPFRIGRFV